MPEEVSFRLSKSLHEQGRITRKTTLYKPSTIFVSQQRAKTCEQEITAALGFAHIEQPNLVLQERLETLLRGPGQSKFKLENVFQKTFQDIEIYRFALEETSGDDNITLAEKWWISR